MKNNKIEKVEEEEEELNSYKILKLCNKKSFNEVIKINAFAMSIKNIIELNCFINLEIISLSLNKIISLKPFCECYKLQELHLRKNNIINLDEIKYLKDLNYLHTLLLTDNPCSTTNLYRLKVIRILTNLQRFDSNMINDIERQEALSDNPELLEFEQHILNNQNNLEEQNKELKGETEIILTQQIQENQTKEIEENVKEEDEFNDKQQIIIKINEDKKVVEEKEEIKIEENKILENYSNVLLATRLLLIDMSNEEVKQLMKWCQERLNNEIH